MFPEFTQVFCHTPKNDWFLLLWLFVNILQIRKMSAYTLADVNPPPAPRKQHNPSDNLMC